MPARPHFLLLAGLLAGLLGDALFQDAGLGLNGPLWLGLLLLAGRGLRGRAEESPALGPWLGLMAFFAGCLAWRASPFLQAWNVLAVLAGAVMVAVRLGGPLTQAWPEHYLLGAGSLAARLVAGPGAAADRLRHRLQEPVRAARFRAVALGTVLAVPVIVVFGALLVSADPVAEGLVERLLALDLLDHALLILVLAWAGTGWLALATGRAGGAVRAPLTLPGSLGLIEIAIPLGALTGLLAAFIGLQIRYLFGGAAVLAATGFTYAEFARRGFFELVVVSVLVVPLLYLAQRLLARDARSAVDSFRALMTVLVVLVACVMISAVGRMRLYIDGYGLTEDRLYATAFMLWIGTVLAWLVVTELRGWAGRFTIGAVLAGFATLAMLNALNPDGLVARINLGRAAAGRALDAGYLARLSPDAVPAVAAAWPVLGLEDRCTLRAGLLARATPGPDWRAWTWSTAAAARAAVRLAAPAGC